MHSFQISYFLLFIAAIVAILTYALIPNVSIVALVSASAVCLAATIWWHAIQFGVDYRTSTWIEQLRNYSAYVMIFVVILCSYGYYTFALSSSPTMQSQVSTQISSIMESPAAVVESVGDLVESITSSITEPEVRPNRNANRNMNRNRNANVNANVNRNKNANNFLI